MASNSTIQFANWLSRIIRWALGLLFIWIAWNYEDAFPLYIFGALTFATGIIKPKRCTAESCATDHSSTDR